MSRKHVKTPLFRPATPKQRNSHASDLPHYGKERQEQWEMSMWGHKTKKEAADALPFAFLSSPTHPFNTATEELVGTIGLEPTTPTMSR